MPSCYCKCVRANKILSILSIVYCIAPHKCVKNIFKVTLQKFMDNVSNITLWCLGIAITWRPLSSVSFYILIFFSETSGPIGTKLGRNVHCMVPYKVYVLFVDQKYTREKEVSKRVCPYIWVLSIYCSFVFDEDLLMHFLRKSLSEIM